MLLLTLELSNIILINRNGTELKLYAPWASVGCLKPALNLGGQNFLK